LSGQRDTTGHRREQCAPRRGAGGPAPRRGEFHFRDRSGGTALRAEPPAIGRNASGV